MKSSPMTGVCLLLRAMAVMLVIATGGARAFVQQTIESVDDGDTIDCVQIDNRTQVMKPERSMKDILAGSYIATKPQEEWQQTWRKHGSCPSGTVPIRRASPNSNPEVALLARRSFTALNASLSGNLEVAAAYGTNGPYLGIQAKIPLWRVNVHPAEFSMNYIMIGYTLDPNYRPIRGAKPPEKLTNQIIVGLVTWPSLHGDSLSRLFVYYTNDSGVNHHCFNHECGGFQLTNNKYALSCSWPNSDSEVGGNRFDVTLGIHRDIAKEIWWVSVMGDDIGYYPAEAFDTRFPEGSYVEMGGRVLNTKPQGKHTKTPMGNGIPACGGARFAATILEYLGISATGQLFKDAADMTVTTTPSCYGANPLGFSTGAPGYAISYGGPGGIYCDLPGT
ncbi:hypothetical protein ACQJBY_053229 [Aegilops geniculata]